MPIQTFQHDELFREAGPEDALDYLWGRLQDRDLSEEEALALLGAVHSKLSTARADPKAYFAYTRFMESLSRELPLVHDYVVAHWIENRRSSRRQTQQAGDSQAETNDEDGPAVLQRGAAPSVSRAEAPSPQVIPVGGGSGEGPEEAGEPDEDNGRGEAPEARQRAPAQADPAADDEDDPPSDQEPDDAKTEADSEDGQQDDEVIEAEEASEAEDDELLPAHDEAETEQPDDEASSDESPQEDGEQVDARDVAEQGEGDKPEAEQGEWPAEEQLEPPEPIEETQSEGDEPSPED